MTTNPEQSTMTTEYQVMVPARSGYMPAYFSDRRQAIEARKRARSIAQAHGSTYRYPIRERDVTEWRDS